jgi:hypothetical protein
VDVEVEVVVDSAGKKSVEITTTLIKEREDRNAITGIAPRAATIAETEMSQPESGKSAPRHLVVKPITLATNST